MCRCVKKSGNFVVFSDFAAAVLVVVSSLTESNAGCNVESPGCGQELDKISAVAQHPHRVPPPLERHGREGVQAVSHILRGGGQTR